MSEYNREIFDWASAKDIVMPDSATGFEAQLAIEAIRSERVSQVYQAIGETLSSKKQQLISDLDTVQSGLNKLDGLRTKAGIEAVENENLLEGLGEKVSMSLFKKVGVNRGYGLNFVSRVSYHLTNMYRNNDGILEENPDGDGSYDDSYMLNVPGLESEFLSGRIWKKGIGPKSLDLIAAFLDDWDAGNPSVTSEPEIT